MEENQGLRVAEGPDEGATAYEHKKWREAVIWRSFGSAAGRELFPDIVLTADCQWLNLRTGEIFPLGHRFR